MNLISPLTLFWCVIYTLAVSLIFIAEILVCARIRSGPPPETNQNQSEAIMGSDPDANPSAIHQLTPQKRSNHPITKENHEVF